ncbi:hypothetical protein [Achromobacter marplatensis]|uniref:Uncharacterized protein n=1 Tax=Achromobacter marplatensis TaxID=470868 RepID=A0AA42W885_9BURK|nr:hypothetical protein [Achromobacter marplatensis]MDH2050459.1 hypothetical protein [Achromobacter marplatensis]
MQKTVPMVSADDASEKQVQPLSEREVLEVSGGANSRKATLISPGQKSSAAPTGVRSNRQSFYG